MVAVGVCKGHGMALFSSVCKAALANRHFPSPALGRGQHVLCGHRGLGKLSLVTEAAGANVQQE